VGLKRIYLPTVCYKMDLLQNMSKIRQIYEKMVDQKKLHYGFKDKLYRNLKPAQAEGGVH
jgi:hypothetical protein